MPDIIQLGNESQPAAVGDGLKQGLGKCNRYQHGYNGTPKFRGRRPLNIICSWGGGRTGEGCYFPGLLASSWDAPVRTGYWTGLDGSVVQSSQDPIEILQAQVLVSDQEKKSHFLTHPAVSIRLGFSKLLPHLHEPTAHPPPREHAWQGNS